MWLVIVLVLVQGSQCWWDWLTDWWLCPSLPMIILILILLILSACTPILHHSLTAHPYIHSLHSNTTSTAQLGGLYRLTLGRSSQWSDDGWLRVVLLCCVQLDWLCDTARHSSLSVSWHSALSPPTCLLSAPPTNNINTSQPHIRINS